MSTAETNKLLYVIIGIIFPPLSVFLKQGAGGSLIINIILTILGYLPGQIHAVWVAIK